MSKLEAIIATLVLGSSSIAMAQPSFRSFIQRVTVHFQGRRTSGGYGI